MGWRNGEQLLIRFVFLSLCWESRWRDWFLVWQSVFPKKSQLNSHNQSQKWALFKLSGVKAWEVSSSILSKKVKSVKKCQRPEMASPILGSYRKKSQKSEPRKCQVRFDPKKLNLWKMSKTRNSKSDLGSLSKKNSNPWKSKSLRDGRLDFEVLQQPCEV